MGKGKFQIQELSKICAVIAVVLLLGMICSYSVYGYQSHYSILTFLVGGCMILAMIFNYKNHPER
ncbi:hypothetical protein [Kurthia massiliensis]|uniref:hypothetical protein n=1 Tax=Kurthia massiliensis TaxID=1033739 RepID=UPI0002897A5B|nr:hypothetical protein [Kurthia massiliensis]